MTKAKKITMTKKLKEEIIKLSNDYTSGLKETDKIEVAIERLNEKSNLSTLSENEVLSEEFIRFFEPIVDWDNICTYQTLSENFIREFKDRVDWENISTYQTLSEKFIREFKGKVFWVDISRCQILSESFIREFKNKVSWSNISRYQKLSEKFIREFENKVCWDDIFSQVFSESFVLEAEKEHPSFNASLYRTINRETTKEEKIKEMEAYAEKNNLKFDGEYLYAFRNHDKWGCGAYNFVLKYQKGKYYRDWHCDMRRDEECSFGLGIWPVGNTPVRVKVGDWGVCVNRDDGKCRVWGFEVL